MILKVLWIFAWVVYFAQDNGHIVQFQKLLTQSCNSRMTILQVQSLSWYFDHLQCDKVVVPEYQQTNCWLLADNWRQTVLFARTFLNGMNVPWKHVLQLYNIFIILFYLVFTTIKFEICFDFHIFITASIHNTAAIHVTVNFQ